MEIRTKDPAETVTVTFDFSPRMSTTENLTGTPTLNITVKEGTDPNPAAMKVGSATTSGQKVFHRVTGGVDGTLYALECVAVTDAGQTLITAGELFVLDASAA